MLLVYKNVNSEIKGNSKYLPDSNWFDNKLKKSRQKLYWISQISGWSLYGLVSVLITISFDRFSWGRLLITLLLCLSGLVLTHVLRNTIKKNNWLRLPLRKIIPRVLISSITIGLLMFGIAAFANIFMDVFHSTEYNFARVAIGIFNLSSIILLWSLIYFSVHYFENYKRVEIESLIWEAAVKDFELKTLKSQLNPHFMFNALNSIRALIEDDPQSAKTAVTKLSNILRYSLKIERTETVSLEDEMQTVSDYLSLETVRFEERLKYDLQIDPESKKVEIPPMMIQTLVENGIKHGISKRTEGGTICIRSKVENSKLHIEIENNGQIEDDAIKNSKGFGISNTKQRLTLLYGDKASFTIKNISDKEVLSELIIPTEGVKNESFNN